MKEKKWKNTHTRILILFAIAIFISNTVIDIAGIKCSIINDKLVFAILIVFMTVLNDRLNEMEDRLKQMEKTVSKS